MSVPTGVVTFLFTDVEGSTRLWAADADAMSESLRLHDEVLRSEIESHGGFVFTTAGDAFCASFDRASDAITAAQGTQQRLADAVWPGPPLKVRMGLHLGEAEERGGDYFGPVVNAVARLAAAGHGSQVLVSGSVHDATAIAAKDLGSHRLRDVAEPMQIWQIGDGEFPSLRTTSQSNLPVPLTKLIGRADDVRAVRLFLRDHRLVTIAGVGGTGKTRLAIAVGDAELSHWRDGVWFADLTEVNDERDVGPAIAAAVGLEVRTADYGAEITRYLPGRELLLVLDNCEHVADECAGIVEDALGAGGRSAVLATSREWLDIDGEQVYQLGSLDTDDPAGDAVRLFVDRATAISPQFELHDGNRSDVRELCRRLDGVPLAIELAASRVTVLSPAELVSGLDDRFRLLSGGRRRQRRRTLEATIDWSYDLLDSEEKRVFRGLGVFVGSFDLVAVAAVCELTRAEATDVVESLYARSLVASSADGEGRFRLLETLKAYAEDRLVDAGEAADCRERHCAHYIERAWVDEFEESLFLDRNAALWVDRPNLALAAEWLESGERWDELAAYLPSIATLESTDWSAWLVRLNNCIDRVETPSLIDGLLVAKNYLHMLLGDWRGFSASARAMRRSEDDLIVARGYLVTAVALARHDPVNSNALIDRCIELIGDRGARPLEDLVKMVRAGAAVIANDLDTALPIAQQLMHEGHSMHAIPDTPTDTVAIAGWSHVRPDAIRASIERTLEPVAMSARRDPLHGQTIRFREALEALVSPGLDSEASVRAYVVPVISGRWAQMHSGALALLADLAIEEEDLDLASALIRETGATRDASSTFLVRRVAAKLGIEDEIETAYAENFDDTDLMVRRPERALRTEIQRRGWAET